MTLGTAPITEIVEWDAEPVEMTFGKQSPVYVQRGDHLLMETSPTGVAIFIEKLGGSA